MLKHALPTASRDKFQFEKSVTVVDTQQLILNSPRSVDSAIYGLKVIKAQACLQCGFMGGTKGSIQEHCKRDHEWQRQDGPWRECYAQSFIFSGSNGPSVRNSVEFEQWRIY